ncbi:MAG: hypothetical protein IJ406_08045 [Oscillospiraceae bacterium]|nr:hypothetical protein [Oscillospiraceae bacterium]
MKEYSSYEIQNISSNFRNIARRLSRTDYSQCNTNLKRFMSALADEELIAEFIERNNVVEYNIPEIMHERGWLDPFEVSPVQNKEISFSVQMLKYAVENFDGNFTRLYGTHYYTSTKSTINDEMRKFIEHIIDPLIDHISEHLRHCYDDVLRKEEAMKPTAAPNFTAHQSTIVIGSHVEGNISNQISITENQKVDANELIAEISSAIAMADVPNKADIEELLQQIKDDVSSDKKPKKGLLTALKVLCQTGSVAIPFVTALMELFA